MDPSSVEPSDKTPALADTQMYAYEKPWGKDTHLRCAWIPDPQKLWGDKCVYVKEVICYTEIDNHYTRHINNYLKCKQSKNIGTEW